MNIIFSTYLKSVPNVLLLNNIQNKFNYYKYNKSVKIIFHLELLYIFCLKTF